MAEFRIRLKKEKHEKGRKIGKQSGENAAIAQEKRWSEETGTMMTEVTRNVCR